MSRSTAGSVDGASPRRSPHETTQRPQKRFAERTVGDAGGRHRTYRITARPQFRVKLAACGGRAGGGSGAERRSRNSVRVRSYSVGSGAPVAVWPRARTRVASPAVPTPHEYPGDRASSPVHEPTVRVFRSRKGPGPRRARCPRAGRRALVVVRGAAAAGRALRASPRPVRRRRAAARAALRPRRRRCGRLRERALQHHRVAVADTAAAPARPHRSVHLRPPCRPAPAPSLNHLPRVCKGIVPLPP